MKHHLALWIMLLVVLMTATTFASLAIVFWQFPLSIGILVVCAAAIIGAYYYYDSEMKKARLNAFYSAVQELGLPILFDNISAAFERDKTRFDIKFPQEENNPSLKINFFVPSVQERFLIQHDSLFKKELPFCQYIQDSPLSKEIFLYAQNREFLLNLVAKRDIINEIYNYPAKYFSRFIISFDHGNFEIEWTPKISEQIDGVYQICKTAVVFYDELKKLN